METTISGNRYSDKRYIAFFDLDRTITNTTSGREMAREAFRRGQMSKVSFLRALYLSLLFRLNLMDPQKIIYEMVSWVRGISETNMEDLSKTIFNDILLPSVRPEAREAIEFHRQNNGFVVILSSALNYICSEMAIHLNVDDIISSEFEIENGILTGHPKGRLCFGDEKRVRLEEYCKKSNANPSEAWYYGDSISDLAVLRSVGNPVCVTPDKYLRKEALKRGWKILDWGS